MIVDDLQNLLIRRHCFPPSPQYPLLLSSPALTMAAPELLTLATAAPNLQTYPTANSAFELDSFILAPSRPATATSLIAAPPDDDDDTATTFLAWKKCYDRFVVLWLRSALAEERVLAASVARSTSTTTTTSRVAWDVLNRSFQSQTTAVGMASKKLELETSNNGAALSMLDCVEKKRMIDGSLAVFNMISEYVDGEFLLRTPCMEIHNVDINSLLALDSQKLDELPANRHVGETNTNLHSSRSSNTVYGMMLERRDINDDEDMDVNACDAVVRVSASNLVAYLAGSARTTGSEGFRVKEISKSLLTLPATVIRNWGTEGVDSQGQLARILQSGIGNRAATCKIIMAQGSHSKHFEEENLNLRNTLLKKDHELRALQAKYEGLLLESKTQVAIMYSMRNCFKELENRLNIIDASNSALEEEKEEGAALALQATDVETSTGKLSTSDAKLLWLEQENAELKTELEVCKTQLEECRDCQCAMEARIASLEERLAEKQYDKEQAAQSNGTSTSEVEAQSSVSPGIRVTRPVKTRRTTKRWEEREVWALKEGIKRFGAGHWMVILNAFRDHFHSQRTSVDLKDKWSNIQKNEMKKNPNQD